MCTIRQCTWHLGHSMQWRGQAAMLHGNAVPNQGWEQGTRVLYAITRMSSHVAYLCYQTKFQSIYETTDIWLFLSSISINYFTNSLWHLRIFSIAMSLNLTPATNIVYTIYWQADWLLNHVEETHHLQHGFSCSWHTLTRWEFISVTTRHNAFKYCLKKIHKDYLVQYPRNRMLQEELKLSTIL